MQAATAEPPTLIRQLAQPSAQGRVVGALRAIADRAPIRCNDGARPPLAHLRISLRCATASTLAAGVTSIGMTCPALQSQREASKQRRRD